MKNRIIFTFIASFLFISVFAQLSPSLTLFKRIELYLKKLENSGFYGSILLDFKGNKILSKGYGFSDKYHNIKNTPKTIFDIGSITKQFTATAILKLEMQGRLTVSDSIFKFFKDVPIDKRNITIHDLLRHQSGLISVVGGDFDKISQEEFLKKVFESKLLFNVGTNFSYSNVGYSLLAMIIENVSGKTYESFLYENLWKPAGMEHTGYYRPNYDTNFVSVGYYDNDKPWGKPIHKEWDKTSPYWHLKGNGGILSTTEDLYKWHKCLLTNTVLSDDAKEKLYNPVIRKNETKASFYAYGWDVSLTSRNTRQIWHNGTNRILYADFLRLIDDSLVVIMLSNKRHQNFDNIGFEIAKIIFNNKYFPEIPAKDNFTNREFTNKILQIVESKGYDAAVNELKLKKGSQQLLEFVMRNKGFDCIDNKKYDLAIAIFKLNAFVYPNSAKALQGLAEGYMETGNKLEAIKYFKKSLKIDPENRFVREMLTQLIK